MESGFSRETVRNCAKLYEYVCTKHAEDFLIENVQCYCEKWQDELY